MTSMATTELQSALNCPVIGPQSPEYEEARALYNGMIDKRPGQIVRCRTADDVKTVVEYARRTGTLLAVRGGGHNGAGLGSCDGGIVLDLGAMKKVEVDPGAGIVRVQPGCTQGEVDAITAPYGLHVPAGIVSTTGIGGLTLGGGHGYLSRQYGLTIDNLLEAEVILADGSRVTASESVNPDLFWALRGGGGNFGVVVSFLFRAHPVTDVFGGPIFYDAAHTREILSWYRSWLPDAPRELCLFPGLKQVPDADVFPAELRRRQVCALIGCYDGPEDDARDVLGQVHSSLPEPLLDGMTQMPFAALQGLFDPLMPKGLQWYWKGDFVEELTDGAIDAHVEHGTRTPSNLSLMHLYPVDGAVHDVGAAETAWGARSANWSMVIAGIDPDPAKAETVKRWAREYWFDVHEHNPHGGAYVNFMMEDEGEARLRASYGANYGRLVEVKRKYDPDNLFRVNQNIKP